jgi:hypothetical protein
MTRDELDTAAAIVRDHPFVPRRAWYEVCIRCGLAEAAHASTTLHHDHEGTT